MVKSGKLPSGKTEIPFEFPLQVKGGKILYETYHGVFVNIQVRIDDSLKKTLLFMVLVHNCFNFFLKIKPRKLMPLKEWKEELSDGMSSLVYLIQV